MFKLNGFSQANLEVAYSMVNEHLKDEVGFEQITYRQIVHAAFKHLACLGELDLEWKRGIPTEEHKDRFLETVKSILVSPQTPWRPDNESCDTLFERIFLGLLRGYFPDMPEFRTCLTLFKAIFWRENKELLKEGRDLLIRLLERIITINEENPLSESQSFHLEVIVGDLLSLFPYLSPEDQSNIKVPVRIEKQWKLVEYCVNEIRLSPTWLGSPLMAYGLTPIEEFSAPPLLIFKGTTFPTDKGFLLSLITDFNLFAGVGFYAFILGKNVIGDWLQTTTEEGLNKAILFGKSLGGVQSCRTGLYFPQFVQKVMAYAAPGFSKYELKKLEEHLDEGCLPEINFFYQKRDPIPYINRVATRGVNYYKILSQRVGAFFAHADICSTHEFCSLIKLDPLVAEKRWTRLTLTFLMDVVSLVVFPILIGTLVLLQTFRCLSHLSSKIIHKIR